MKIARRVAVIILIVLLPVVTGAVGYFLGRADRSDAVWTDREATLTGNGPWISTLRCTYHQADGTTRKIESATVVITSAGLFAATNRECPPSP